MNRIASTTLLRAALILALLGIVLLIGQRRGTELPRGNAPAATGSVKTDALVKPTFQNPDLALLKDTAGYQIVYLKPYDTFLISILESPFGEVRRAAEEEFLQTIAKGDAAAACRLAVKITTPSFANPEQDRREYPLSFCP